MWTWLILIGLATVLLWAVVLYWHCMTTGSALKPALDPSTMLVHTPRTSKSLGSSAGVCSIQGRRRYMEDSFHAEVDLVGDDRGSAFFGVYDGHGGAKASQFAADRVHKLLLERDFRASPAVALMEAILQTDVDWLEMANQYNCDDGSTLITLFVHGGRMYVGNVGDSRAVLVSDDKAIAMSDDHKPSRQDERNRIEKLGGSVIFHGTW